MGNYYEQQIGNVEQDELIATSMIAVISQSVDLPLRTDLPVRRRWEQCYGHTFLLSDLASVELTILK